MRERKTDTTELLDLHEKGMTVTELARHFGCSKANISKRLARLIPAEIPEGLKNLTSKQRAFVIAKASGKSATAAALETHDCRNRESAKALGHELMEQPDIERAISEVLQKEGLTKKYRVRKLKSHVDNRNPDVSLRALDQSWRLDGSYSADKHLLVTASYADMSASLAELIKKQKELAHELGIDETFEGEFEQLDKPEGEEESRNPE